MPNFLQGLEAGTRLQQSNENAARKSLAYNALKAAYGDVAGDPQAAATLEATKEKQTAFPDVQQQLRAKTSQENSAAKFADVRAKAAEQTQRNAALLNGATFIQSAIDRGADPGAAFDQIAPHLGMDPDLAAGTRAEIVKDPTSVKGFIAALQKHTAESNRFQVVQGSDGKVYRVTQDGVEPLSTTEGKSLLGAQSVQGQERIDQGANRLQQQKDLAQPGFKGDVKAAEALGAATGKRNAEDLPASQTGQVKAAQGQEAVKQSFDVADSAIDKAVGETSWLTAGPLSHLPDFLNPQAAELRGDLNVVTSKVVLDTISEMKTLSKGSTGFGQLSDREGALIQARLGAVLQASRPQKLKEALTALQGQLKISRDRINNAYKADRKARGQDVSKTDENHDTTGGRVEGDNIVLKWNAEKGTLE